MTNPHPLTAEQLDNIGSNADVSRAEGYRNMERYKYICEMEMPLLLAAYKSQQSQLNVYREALEKIASRKDDRKIPNLHVNGMVEDAEQALANSPQKHE